MKTKVNLLILLTVVTVILSSCGASRKAGCDAYVEKPFAETMEVFAGMVHL